MEREMAVGTWEGVRVMILMFFTRGQFWPSVIVVACICMCVCVCPCVCVSVCLSQACLHHSSSPVQVWISKFGPEVQNTLVKIPIVWGSFLLWSSRSNLTSKSKFHYDWFIHQDKYTTTRVNTWLLRLLHSPDWFTVSFLCTYRTYISRLLHGPDCFSLNLLHAYWSRQPRVFWRLTLLL